MTNIEISWESGFILLNSFLFFSLAYDFFPNLLWPQMSYFTIAAFVRKHAWRLKTLWGHPTADPQEASIMSEGHYGDILRLTPGRNGRVLRPYGDIPGIFLAPRQSRSALIWSGQISWTNNRPLKRVTANHFFRISRIACLREMNFCLQ